METMNIKEFYAGKTIFITGGTGFMGKVLIEKLIRSCPGIEKIFVLMRYRKEKNITDRMKDMITIPLFEKIRTEKPGILEQKVIPVFGDLTQIRLGLSDEDYEMLIENVSIVFHFAATVRFDEPLHDAIIKNVRGTREVVQIASKMKNLMVCLHLSTTYSNCNRVYVDEKMYDSPIKWQDAILIAENLDPKLSEACSTKFLGSFPNTYTLTKLLAEHVVSEEATKSNMPVVIYRPSIVISTLSEPVVGWIDNINGPMGLFIACGKGISVVTLADSKMSPDFMAVDISIKAIIIAAYHRGKQTTPLKSELPVYNGSSAKKSITNQELLQLAVKFFMLHPFDEILWRPRIFVTHSKQLYAFLTILQQVIPAMLITTVFNIVGKTQKINLVKLQQKIYIATMALSYFALQTWTFKNSNFLNLIDIIPNEDKEDFDFSFEDVNVERVFVNNIIGTQKYLFNSDPKKLMQAKKKLKILVWMDRILRTLFFVFIAWILLKLICFL